MPARRAGLRRAASPRSSIVHGPWRTPWCHGSGETADLDGLEALAANGTAAVGDLREAFGDATEIVARDPAGGAEGAAALAVEQADLPEFLGHSLEEVRCLVIPEQLAR